MANCLPAAVAEMLNERRERIRREEAREYNRVTHTPYWGYELDLCNRFAKMMVNSGFRFTDKGFQYGAKANISMIRNTQRYLPDDTIICGYHIAHVYIDPKERKSGLSSFIGHCLIAGANEIGRPLTSTIKPFEVSAQCFITDISDDNMEYRGGAAQRAMMRLTARYGFKLSGEKSPEGNPIMYYFPQSFIPNPNTYDPLKGDGILTIRTN